MLALPHLPQPLGLWDLQDRSHRPLGHRERRLLQAKDHGREASWVPGPEWWRWRHSRKADGTAGAPRSKTRDQGRVCTSTQPAVPKCFLHTRECTPVNRSRQPWAVDTGPPASAAIPQEILPLTPRTSISSPRRDGLSVRSSTHG